jgi:hypothetical protein
MTFVYKGQSKLAGVSIPKLNAYQNLHSMLRRNIGG